MNKVIQISSDGFKSEVHLGDLSPYVDGNKSNPVLAWSKGLSFKSLKEQNVATGTSTYPHGLLSLSNDWMFLSFNQTGGGAGRLMRIKDISSLSTQGVLTFASDSNHNECFKIIYIPSKDRIYATFNSSGRIVVSEIDPYPDTMTTTDVINDTTHSMGGWGAIATDNEYLYVLTNTNPCKIIKYSLSTWLEVASATLTDLNGGHALEWDGADHLFATGAVSPGWIAKIAISNLAFTSASLLTGDNIVTDDIVIVGERVYVGIESGNGVVYIFDTADLSYTRYSGGWSGICWGAFYDGRYVIMLYPAANSLLVFIDPVTSEMFTKALPSTANVNELIRIDNYYVYTQYQSPGRVGTFCLEADLDKVNFYSENELILPTAVGDVRALDYQTVTVDTNSVGAGAALTLASDGNYDMARGDSLSTMKRVVIALESGTGSKTVAVSGLIYTSATLTVGGYIYVSPSSAGNITQTEPSNVGEVITPIGIALTANVWYLFDVEYWVLKVAAATAPKFVIPHTFAVQGEIKVPVGDTDFIPPFYVKAPTGQTVKLVSARYKINSGTSVTAKIQVNGSDATGFTSMSVGTTVGETDPTDITLSNNDVIALVVTAVSGTPKNMSFTIFLEYS
jgi:hypothetical protein